MSEIKKKAIDINEKRKDAGNRLKYEEVNGDLYTVPPEDFKEPWKWSGVFVSAVSKIQIEV